jgi:hypothetical protein
VWGMGALGRLGLGNELDQPVPLALEIESVGVDVMPSLVDGSDGLTVAEYEDNEDESEEEERVLLPGDVITAIGCVDMPEDGAQEFAYALLNGPDNTKVMVNFIRKVCCRFPACSSTIQELHAES